MIKIYPSGVKGQIFKFCNNSVSCQYFYGNFACRQGYNKYETNCTCFAIEGLCLTPCVDLGVGSEGQNSTFSEHGHVAYQIKENHKCSNMVANILPRDAPHALTMGMGSIGQNSTFSEHGHIALQIKGSHEFSNMVANILHTDPLPQDPRLLGQKIKTQLSEHGHVEYQIKGNHGCSSMVTNNLLSDTPLPKVNLGIGEM